MNREQKRERRVFGYFTVEASLIVPMVLVILLAVIRLSFFLYDRAVLEQDAWVYAYRESLCADESERSQVEREAGQRIREQLLLTSDLKVKLGGGESASFSGTLQVHSPLSGQRRWTASVHRTLPRYDPAGKIWRLRRAQALWRAVSGESAVQQESREGE